MKLKFRRKTLEEKIRELAETHNAIINKITYSRDYIEIDFDKTTLPDITIQKIKEKLEKMELIRIG